MKRGLGAVGVPKHLVTEQLQNMANQAGKWEGQKRNIRGHCPGMIGRSGWLEGKLSGNVATDCS